METARDKLASVDQTPEVKSKLYLKEQHVQVCRFVGEFIFY